ncbi:MAG: 3R-hydroxymyristoyl ACP [Geobacteraceae bacterium]|nr:MAG: 3R-hydroxymyristoyl ACP [Geobacteraceae bacterium]
MRSISTEAPLFKPDPAAYLPHRNPFLHIDRVLALEPGVSASGVKKITWEGVSFPPILLLEAMAQLAGIAAGQREGEGGVLAAIERGNLPAAVNPGDTVLIVVRIVKAFGRLFLVEGEARVEEATVASATLTLAIGTMQ